MNRNQTRFDKTFDSINVVLLCLVLFLTLYPLYFVLIASISNPIDVMSGRVWLLPKAINVEAYRTVFKDQNIMTGYKNTLIYTSLGILLNVVMTVLGAYPLSRRDFRGRKGFTLFFTFTMFFSGGLVPTFLVVKQLGLIDHIGALLLPTAVSMWNIFITRTYFQSMVPFELQEAAFVDGSTNTGTLCRIVLPLSLPIIAVMTLFYGVAHWNAYFNAMIYLNDNTMYPLQLVLRQILILQNLSADMTADMEEFAQRQMLAEGIKYALIIVSSIPVLMLYPFLQRYFVKGVMIGAIKG